MRLKAEIQRRRTFAIVSHPDAGKTTLTEKLLLFGGAIHEAGAVKSNKIRKTATSDFMEIEKQRGISVATSVMGFEYMDTKVNILDTPGHKDFAEDTYRTLSAVDSVIAVVDAAKGVEEQTLKLVEVCRMRDTPIIFFINKLDREGLESFDLLDEIEKKLKVKLCPLAWNIGMGRNLKGIYDLRRQRLTLFEAVEKQKKPEPIHITDLDDPSLASHIGLTATAKLKEELELVTGVYPAFESEKFLSGEICPVFFGSALNNFGVQELLDTFIEIAPWPQPMRTEQRLVRPEEEAFSGFVFKIHANIDPNHRNRIAFVKVCSGVFQRNNYYTHVRLDKKLRFSSPTAFMASKKEVVDEAFPGDIVGLYDVGNFKIGDALTEGEDLKFLGIPSFSPELFRYIENADPMKSKQLQKGIEQLMDEGVAQLFTKVSNGRRVIGTVGPLQFEVIEYRLLHEYGATSRYEQLPIHKACWVEGDAEELADLKKKKHGSMAVDKQGRDVFLADSQFILQNTQQNYPKLRFLFKAEL